MSRSSRGVMVDYRDIRVGTTVFRVMRMHARTTFLRWHIGSQDPPEVATTVPADAASSIDWTNEGPPGVVAVFNGGFKKPADAGGAVVDGVVLESLVRGDMTLAIDAEGHWAMGVWGSAKFPTKGFHAISYRQNLGPLIENSALLPDTAPSFWRLWGSPLNQDPLTSRSGLGIDDKGNLIYAAAIGYVDVQQLGTALLEAGAVTGMELDINPFWPILGGARTPLHASGVFPLQLPLEEHNPSIYETGWERDFFVAMAEPNSWSCNWASPGVHVAVSGPQPQPLRLTGTNCATSTPTTTSTNTTNSSPSTTTSVP